MYHINSDQKVGRCSAKPGQCPFGGESEHFDTALSAEAEVERRKTSEAEQNSKVASKRKRKVRGTKGTASDNPDQTSGDGKMSDRSRTIGVNWQPGLASDHEAFFARLREEFQVACQNGYISERFSGLHRVWLIPPTHEDDTSSSPSSRVRVIIYHGVREDFAPKMRDVPFHSIEAAVSPSCPAVLDPGTTPERQNLDVALMKDPELADHIQKLENIMSTFRGPDFEIDTEFGLPSDRLFSQHMMMRCLSRIKEVYPDTIRAEKRDEALQVVKREADTYAYHYSRDCYFKGLQEKREKLNRSASEITPEVLEQDEVEYAKIHTSDLARAERYIALGDHLDQKFPMVYKSKVLQVPLV